MSKAAPDPYHPLPVQDPFTEALLSPGHAADGAAEFREIVAAARRNMWLILLVAAATTAVAVWLAFQQAPRYAATAVVRIADVRRSLTGGIETQAMERFTGSLADPLLSQIGVLRSRVLIGRAVDATGQRLRSVDVPSRFITGVSITADAPADTFSVRFTDGGYRVRGSAGTASARYGEPVTLGGVGFSIVGHPGVSTGEIGVISRDEAIDRVLAGLTARPRERTDVIDLRFEHADPTAAQLTLNSLAETFHAVSAERARLQSLRRRLFLEEQLQATDSLLALSQLDLSRFRERESAFSTRDRFMAQQQSLAALDIRREELIAERNAYHGLLTRITNPRGADPAALRAVVSNPALASNPAIAQLNTQLLRYETALDSLMGGAYPMAASHPEAQRLESLRRTTEARIAETLRGHVGNLEVRIAALSDLRARNVTEIQSMPQTEADEVRLAQAVVTTQAMADQLRREYQLARISEAVEAGQVEILDPAGRARPLPSRRAPTILLGMLVGLVIGAGVSLVREQLNTSIRRRDEVERLLGVPTLAVIPRIGSARAVSFPVPGRSESRVKGGGPDETLVSVLHTRTAGAEAFRSLRTNLIFAQAVQKVRVVAVTSAGSGEGKSTTSANLAAAFAQQGLRVLLVDCDLRRPRLHELFGLDREPGMTQYLLGLGTLEELARPTVVPGLQVMCAGTLPPNPAELLGSQSAREALAAFGERFDVVMVDTPPVLLASDAAILGGVVDATLLVVRAAHTSRHAASLAVRQLEAVGTRILGVVLNDPDAKLPSYEGSYGYGYGYQTYYGDVESQSRRDEVSTPS